MKEFKKFKVRISENLERNAVINTDDYTVEEGQYKLNAENLHSLYTREHLTIKQLLNELADYVVLDMRNGISNNSSRKLETLYIACREFTDRSITINQI